MDRLEMASKLFDNPKLKAISNKELVVYAKKIIEFETYYQLVYEATDNPVYLYKMNTETWKIIEPKLKEFCFGELQYILINKPYISYVNCKSVVSGGNLAKLRTETTLEELKGKWTIEGYYEEDDNEKE